jgi:hypothetical protein
MKHYIVFLIITGFVFNYISVVGQSSKKELQINFQGDAKIEVGSYFAGLEFHHSCPVPQRFSFYYPVANSIDLSTDYWKRDTTFVMDVGLKFGCSKTEWLNNQSLPFLLTPFSVDFKKEENEKTVEISYVFTKDKPALVITYSVTNNTKETKEIEFYTKLALSFRTSHSFKLSNIISKEVLENGRTVLINHNDSETQNAQMFIVNGKELPKNVQFAGLNSQEKDIVKDEYPGKKFVGDPSVNFIYRKTLAPGEKYIITQVIGTCKGEEGKSITGYLMANYENEVRNFEKSILKKIAESTTFRTGNEILDRSVLWAKAMLETNRHYIDGEIMPMPCPAEYNFYFTHDVLLTDLAAVNYDLVRVKNDLRFIKKLANNEKMIPHAYYWKDSSFVTEFADHDNWNNFWFIIVASEYLKHSGDKKFSEDLYPYVEKSLSQALKTKGKDDLMWSYRPDWWDIGRKYGQRSYMTILAIKAIRSFSYFSTVLGKAENRLLELELLSERMTGNLNEKLWMDKYGYLMNSAGADTLDEHYYSGSLLAAHYGLIDKDKIAKMINTANQKIVDKKVGVYTIYPMDLDTLKDYWHFSGNEAGAKYYYLNGGIWPQSNTWYSLALMANNKKEEAVEFIKKIMTIDGIMNGPNGQPAMYEVRNGNIDDQKVYGTIDKPQFMWAAGWYLYSLYNLFGLNNNEWNIELNPFLIKDQQNCSFDLTVNGKSLKVRIGRGELQKEEIDGNEMYSYVIPGEVKNAKNIQLTLGKTVTPFVKTSNSILKSCLFDKKTGRIKINLLAFKGHNNKTILSSSQKPKTIMLNGEKLENIVVDSLTEGYLITINFKHKNKIDLLEIVF